MTPVPPPSGGRGAPGEVYLSPAPALLALPPLHSSEAKLYQSCPRRWYHAHVARRVARVQAPALERGTAVHTFLASWWKREGIIISSSSPGFDPVATACCVAYAAYWGAPLESAHPWRTEVPFTTSLGTFDECAACGESEGRHVPVHAGTSVSVVDGGECPGFEPACVRVAGTLDGVNFGENPTTQDDLVILEHKTTSEDITPGSPYWARVITTDVQVSLYRAAFPRARIVYDVIRKPKAERRNVPKRDEHGVEIVLDEIGHRVPKKDGSGWRRTGDSGKGFTLQTREETDDEMCHRLIGQIGENPAAYFMRATVVRLESEDDAFKRDLIDVDRLRRKGPWPRNPSSCNSYGRRCEYYDVCWGAATLSDDTLFRDQDADR